MMRAPGPVPVLLVAFGLGIADARAADSATPLPDDGGDAALSEKLLHRLSGDRLGLQRYRYVESVAVEKRDTDGSLKSRTVEVNEVSYQDGVRMKRPLAEDEVSPPEGVAVVRREEARFMQPASSGAAGARKDRSRSLDIEKLVACFSLRPLGEEAVAGRRLLKVGFTPIGDCIDDGSRAGRLLQNLTGHLWIDPDSADLIRVEGHLLRPVTFGFGLLGKVDDFRIEVEREPLENDLFAIGRVDYHARGTSFIFNRFDIRSVRQRSAFVSAPPAGDLSHPPTATRLPGAGQPGATGGQR